MTQTLNKILETAAFQNIPATTTHDDGSVDLKSKAMLLKYEALLREVTHEIINDHSSSIQTVNALHEAIATYDEDYLLSQPVSYLGMAALAEELIGKCRTFNVDPPEHWIKVARLRLDWESEIESLEFMGS